MNKILTARKLLLLLLLVCCCGDLLAYASKATDAAFAALLSMPGGEPASGQWRTPVPDDFSPGTESALIVYLAQKQKAGADFNAYRHQGTLLHHAIRAGKNQTAAWLLAHGADPAMTVGGGAGDALALSLAYKRTSLARLLQDKYGLKPPPPARATPETLPRMASPTDVAGARAMLARAAWLGVVASASEPAAAAKDAAGYRQMLASWDSAVAHMAPGIYGAVIDDDAAMADLVKLHCRGAPQMEHALAGIPAAILKRHAKAAIDSLADQARNIIDSKTHTAQYTVPAEVWRALWRHLDKPLDYTGRSWLAQNLQPELWPELFAGGYGNRRSETALGCMLTETGALELKALWPRLVENFPDIRQAAPRMVLAHYRMAGATRCWGWDADATRDKLLFLASIGIKEPVKGILQQELVNLPPGLLAAMRPFLTGAAAKGAAAAPRLVDASALCTFTLTDPWFRKLLEPTIRMGSALNPETINIATVQLLEIPGEAECGLLVGGTRDVGFALSRNVADSFTGPSSDPVPSCIDPQDRYVVWQNRHGTIAELRTDMGDDDGSPQLVPVRDTGTGRRYYLHDGEQFGKCHSRRRLPFTFEWRRSGTQWSLMRSNSEALEAALFDQCGVDENRVMQCRGIAAIAADRPEEKTPGGFRTMDIAAFVKTFAQGRYRAYLDAVSALDKPKLKAMQAAGIPGVWTADAIVQVGASALPLAAKRARTAWIFADRAQLARAINLDVFGKLMAWLPREDWRPLLDIAAKNPQAYSLDYLRKEAQEKGQEALACDIDNAAGLVCGETLETD